MAFSVKGLEPFQFREYAYFFFARFFAGLSISMVDVAVGWLVYEMTGSAVALGLIGLAAFTPNILFLLIAGHVADRYDRRMVLMLCYGLSTLASLGLLLIAVLRVETLPLIYALVFLAGASRAFFSPASAALLPSLVGNDQLANAIALGSTATKTATIIGPAIGGVAYLFGAPFVFFCTTALSVTCVILTSLLKRRPAAGASELSWEYLTAGLKSIWSNSTLLGLISLDLFAVLLGGATALLPMFAKDIFNAGPVGLGLLRSAPSVGAIVTALLLARFPLNHRVGLRMFQSVAVFGLMTIGFGLSPTIHMALICLVILGAADMVSVYIRQTLVQLETPDAMRGRVSAVNSLFVGASNELGQFYSGIVASLAGPVLAVVIGGGGAVAVTLAWMRLFPHLKDRDRLV